MMNWNNSERPDLMLAELGERDDLRATIEDLIKVFIRDMSESKDADDLNWYDQLVESMLVYDNDRNLARLCSNVVCVSPLPKFPGMANLIRLYIPVI